MSAHQNGLLAAVLLPPLAVAACNDNQRLSPSADGELVAGEFSYACVDLTDPRCNVEEVTFPRLIAAGAEFSLQYELSDKTDTSQIELSTASDSGATVTGPGQFMMQADGLIGILALDGAGNVVDVIHVTGRSPTGIAVLALEDEGFNGVETILVEPGGSVDVRAEVTDLNADALAGSTPYEFAIGDESIASMTPGESSNKITLSAGSTEGETTLTVTALGQSNEVPVTVGFAPATSGDDGATSTTASGSTGADSGGDTTTGPGTTTGGSASTSGTSGTGTTGGAP